MRRSNVYKSYDEDIVTSKKQNIQLKESYSWVDESKKNKIISACVYKAAYLFSVIYSRLILRVKIVGGDDIRKAGAHGFFVYGNHTQVIGDAFVPAYLFRGSRIRTIVSVSNLGIPILGKLLPYMGALPVPDTDRLKSFLKAVEYYNDKGNGIIIYPEAHVWPYYTHIRPFGTASFSYPVKRGSPVYCMTTTYQKLKHGKRPAVTVYIDGPITFDRNKPASQQKKELHRKVRQCMEERSKNSNYEYWKYEEKQ